MKECTWDCHALYFRMIGRLRDRARELGYALGVHGSLARDLDLIACPWTETASSPEDLAEALRAKVGGVLGSKGHERPHGRRIFVIHLGGGPYIDLSVMPRTEE